MRADQINRRWSELDRLRHLQMVGAEMAVGDALKVVAEASDVLDIALAARDEAMAGWHAQLGRQLLDPTLLQAWRNEVTRAATPVTAGTAALTDAETILAAKRRSWLAAQQQHELARRNHKAARWAARREHEERALATVSDILAQRRVQAQ